MAESLRAASEPITLRKCLEAMTREEELGEEEKYYCSECKKHQVGSFFKLVMSTLDNRYVTLSRFGFIFLKITIDGNCN